MGVAVFIPAAISLTPILHLARFMACFFSKPTLLLSFSTCTFHVFFGYPGFLLPLTSNSKAFLRTCPSSLLNTCRTISLHLPLPSEPLFRSILTSPSGNLFSFSPSVLHHTLLSPLLSRSSSSVPYTPLYLSHSYSLYSKSPTSPWTAHQASHHTASSACVAHGQGLHLSVCGRQVRTTPAFGQAGALVL